MTSTAARGQTLAGIGLMLTAILLFSSNDVLAKWLAGSFAVGQMVLLRSVGAFVVLSPFLWRAALSGRFRRVERPWLHALRVACGTGEVACFYLALSLMPLADVMTFWMGAPIFVAVLSALVLSESVPPARWVAIVLGFGGVVIALWHELDASPLGAVVALSGSLMYAVFLVATRALRATPDALLVGFQMTGALLLGLVLAPFAWTPPALVEWPLLLLIGVISTIGHVCVARALRLAPASVVVPFKYLSLVFATFYGWAIFGDVPRAAMLTGAAVIIAAGLWLWRLERRAGG